MSVIPEKPRVVLTGAGGGLGQAFAQLLAKRQARMLLIDVQRAQETAELVRSAGGQAHVMQGDVADPATMQNAAEWMRTHHQGTDLLINNAGVAAAGAIGEFPVADWEWVMRINLNGVFYGCHAFVPDMKAARCGAIINVASCAGLVSLPTMGAYNASKAGVVSLTETLDAEVRQFGITVSALCPTFFPTRLLESFRTSDQGIRANAEKMFRASLMNAEQVARASLDGVQNRDLIVVPQIDGRLAAAVKRLLPPLYRAAVRSAALQKRFMQSST